MDSNNTNRLALYLAGKLLPYYGSSNKYRTREILSVYIGYTVINKIHKISKDDYDFYWMMLEEIRIDHLNEWNNMLERFNLPKELYDELKIKGFDCEGASMEEIKNLNNKTNKMSKLQEKINKLEVTPEMEEELVKKAKELKDKIKKLEKQINKKTLEKEDLEDIFENIEDFIEKPTLEKYETITDVLKSKKI